MLLLLISLIAGMLTALAPCVLPLLPVMLGGSVGGPSGESGAKERLRPYIIAVSLASSVVIFTLVLKLSTVLVNLSPNVLNYISGGLLIGLGFAAILPELWEALVIKLNWNASSLRFLGIGETVGGKYAGPILIGMALGPVFASCSPTYAFILASVLPHSFASGLIYLVAYSIGLVGALLVISLLGMKFISRFRWTVDTHSLFRRIIGIIFVLIGVAIISGQEIKIETWVANHLPFDETRIERVLLARQTGGSLIHKLDNSVLNVKSTPAPEFVGLTNWINSPPLTVAGLKGKVVLVDFWTYSCINCIRSLPYVEKWYQTYQNQGLVVVGVSAPEFAFEHNPTNVAEAVKKDGLTYPVALDNNLQTWDAFQNSSWPADYLIDKDGNIRYVSLGEGDYDKTEKAIQTLLGINQALTTPTSNVPISSSQTPETYFGTNRAANYVGTPALHGGNATYSSAQTGTNEWTLNGSWQVGAESITSASGSATLTFQVNAKDVYVVASAAANSTMTVGLPSADAGQYGADAPGGKAAITKSRLYHIVSLKKFGQTTITLHVPAGVSLYTFTFGS